MAEASHTGTQEGPAASRSQWQRFGWPVVLMLAATTLELLLVMPFADHWADESPTFHFTQHGLIFLGGIAIGISLREVYLRSRR